MQLVVLGCVKSKKNFSIMLNRRFHINSHQVASKTELTFKPENRFEAFIFKSKNQGSSVQVPKHSCLSQFGDFAAQT